tara:strand:+ start:600 stop:2849 length:2250 start_codon:yes stop_codon:yes gene_type:complete
MIQYLYKIFIIILFLCTSSYSENIKKIDITGNKRISAETILVLSNIKINNDFTNDSLNKSLKLLYETDFFSDIKFSINNGILKIEVNENPIIEKININGIKKKSFVENIYSLISLKDRTSYTNFKLEKDISLIKNILKTNGYYFSSINVSSEKDENLNSVILNLDIELGEKAKIKEILFIGDKKFKDKKLLELIASEEFKFWKFITNKVYLNKSLIDLDKRLLENYYKNNGYYNVKVLNSFAELNKEGFFKLIFNINSGKKYYFNDLVLNLPNDYDQTDFREVLSTFNNLKNEKYSLNNINLILDDIDQIASLRLYDFIDVEVSEKIVDNNKINFIFKVTDSEKFYVEKINILGNFNTIEEVVRNKLIVDEGDPFNKLLHNKSINEIKALGIFKSVKSEIINGSNPNTKILNISVDEKPTGEISLGAGYGTDGGVIGGSLTEKNFLGKGITLDTDFQISADGVKGALTYSKPNFNYTDNTLFTSLKSTSLDNLSSSGYKINTAGLSIGTTFEQYENFFFSPEVDITIEDLTTNSSASNTLKKQEGSYNDFYFNYGLTYDLRNSSYNPTSGNIIRFFQKLPIAATDNEIENTFVFSSYKALNSEESMIGKASLYINTVNSIDGSDVRISKRSKIPYNRLRGFEKGKVGPTDSGDYIGGNYSAAINLSTNLPGILSTLESLDFSYFIDMANVWGVDYDGSIDESNQLRSSTGVAMDYLSPIGPLSFSWTLPVTKKSSDKTETFRFNLGTTF